MSTLLALPRELRDEIIGHVLSAYTEPTRDPCVDASRRQLRSTPSTINHYVLPPHKIYSAFGLLLANWQLHSETRQRLRRTALRYKADVMVATKEEVWSSWVCCPIRQKSFIDTVDVTFRTPRTEEPFLMQLARILAFQDVTGPRPVLESMLDILNTCCEDNNNSAEVHRIRRLRLNFIVPHDFPQDIERIGYDSNMYEKLLATDPALKATVHRFGQRAIRSCPADADARTIFRQIVGYLIADRLSSDAYFIKSFRMPLEKVHKLRIYVNGERFKTTMPVFWRRRFYSRQRKMAMEIQKNQQQQSIVFNTGSGPGGPSNSAS